MKRKIILIMLVAVTSICYARERIILLNEGNWQADNGRVSYFEDGAIVSNQWFRDVNGYKLGDTPNDIIQVNDSLIAIAINWSNIVQFIRPDGTAVAATENVPNNRKLASDGKYVYVSSYGHECETISGMVTFDKGYVAKIDVTTFQVVATVEVGFEPEGIALYDGHLFVANTGGYAFQEDHEYETTVSIIDASTMELERNVDTQQINLYGKLSQIGRYLCINSPGDYYETPACGIIFDCEAALEGSDQCFVTIPYATTYSCATQDGHFLAIGSRFSYNTYDYEFNYITIDPQEALLTEGTSGITEELPGNMLADISKMTSPYGIYVNPYTGYIYATDAGSYAEGGALFQWSPEGELQGQYEVYINPAHFLALPPDEPVVDDIKTIDSKKTTNAETFFYNINGQRVTNPTKGIYIYNGKKLIIR